MRQCFGSLRTSPVQTVEEPEYTGLPYGIYTKDINSGLSTELQRMVFTDLGADGRVEYRVTNLNVDWDAITALCPFPELLPLH